MEKSFEKHPVHENEKEMADTQSKVTELIRELSEISKKDKSLKGPEHPYKEEADIFAVKFYETIGDKEKVQEILNRLAKDYETKNEYLTAAEAYKKLGNFSKAKEMWEKTIEYYSGEEYKKNHYGSIFPYLAIAYENLGQEKEAREMWEQEAKKCENGTLGYDLPVAAKIYLEKLHNNSKAKEMAKKIVEGWLYYLAKGKGDYDDYKRAIESYQDLLGLIHGSKKFARESSISRSVGLNIEHLYISSNFKSLLE